MDTSFPSIYAIQEGEFEIVKWLHKNGCPCNENSYRAARENCQWRIEKWIEQQLSVWKKRRNNSLDIWTLYWMAVAVSYGMIRVLITRTSVLVQPLKLNHFSILRCPKREALLEIKWIVE